MKNILVTLVALGWLSGPAVRLEAGDFAVSPAASGGATFARLSRAGDVIQVAPEGGPALEGRLKNPEKRRYESGGQIVYVVKYKEGKAKLRGADDAVLWTVKYKDGKIKVGRGEEATDPFSIKSSGEGAFKVAADEEPRGKVRFEAGKVRVTDASGATVYAFEAPAASAAYGLLLASEIPADQRSILIAEILAAGR